MPILRVTLGTLAGTQVKRVDADQQSKGGCSHIPTTSFREDSVVISYSSASERTISILLGFPCRSTERVVGAL